MKNLPHVFFSLLISHAFSQEVIFTIQTGSAGTVSAESTGIITGNDQAVITYSGTLTTLLDLDPDSNRIRSIEFSESTIANSDFDLTLSSGTLSVRDAVRRINIAFGGKTVSYDSETTTTGTFTLADQQLETYEGSLLLNGNLLQEYALDSDLEQLVGDPCTIISTPILPQIPETLVWDLSLVLNLRKDDTFSDELGTLTEQETGTINATAQLSLPSPYGEWAQFNSIEAGQAFERDTSGIPNILLFSFDLAPNSNAILPIQIITPASGSSQVSVTPPPGGMRRTVRIEYSPDLATAFIPLEELLPTDEKEDAILREGEISTAVVNLPEEAGQKGFVRLTAAP